MKLLNLDELAVAPREVQLGGKVYPIAEQSVEQMIVGLELQEAAENADSPKNVLLAMKRSIKAILPTCPEKVINSLSLKNATAIIEFASASDKEVIEGSEQETVDNDPEVTGKK